MDTKTRKLIESLLNDIDAMRTRDEGHWFGAFSYYNSDPDTLGCDVEWPNLSLTAQALRKHLEEGK